ncbi:MAG: elongation factor P [candidate division WOR-3 bacterium]
MITPNDFKNGTLIKYKGEVYSVVSYSRTRTAQRRARVLAKIRNIKTGALLEESFESETRLEEAEFEQRRSQYMYSDDLGFHFMDLQNYDQFTLSAEIIGDKKMYLTENAQIDVLYVEGRPVDVQPPMFLDLEVVETDPDYRGDTATGSGKRAVLSTGMVVNVPFFIKVGDKVRIDTRTNTYVERA